MSLQDTREELMIRIKILSDMLWENNCRTPDILEWLDNFDGRYCSTVEIEQLHALHLLASVSYFGLRELRVLLRSMFRDLFRYPIIQKIRDDMSGSTDTDEINKAFTKEQQATRFIGMGNPAESGTHLLYYFRQENQLHRSLFITPTDLLTGAMTDKDVRLADTSIRRLVFIDDFCGSGEQAERYSKKIVPDIRAIAAKDGCSIEFNYLVLFGTSDGLDRARRGSDFNSVNAVSRIDSTYRTFGSDSRIFRKSPASIDRAISERMAIGYGSELWPLWPLGYENWQLLIAFHHNIPDNSLPILWFDEGNPPWIAAFARHKKIG